MGMAWAPAMMLKSRYHWVDSTMSSTQLTPRPMPRPWNTRMRLAKISEEGKEAATCTTDWRRRDHLGDMPIQRPTGRVQRVARKVESSTREREAPPAFRRCSHWPGRTSTSRRTTDRPPRARSPMTTSRAEPANHGARRPGRVMPSSARLRRAGRGRRRCRRWFRRASSQRRRRERRRKRRSQFTPGSTSAPSSTWKRWDQATTGRHTS